MSPRFTLTNLARAIVLSLAIALVIALVMDRNSNEERITVRTISSNNPAVPPPGLENAKLSDVPGPGALLMLQGQQARRLVFLPLYGDRVPQVVDSQVSSIPLLPNPRGTHVLYSTSGALMVLDIDARRVNLVGTLPTDSYVRSAQWSPDGRAIAYVIQQDARLYAYYTLADGSIEAQEFVTVHQGLELGVAWLPEGMPVAITTGIDPAVGGIQAQYLMYAPDTNDVLLLPPDVEVIQPWSPWRSPDGTRQVYAVRNWEAEDYRQDCKTGPLIELGPEWLPVATQRSARTYEALFEMPGLYLDRPTWLDDGRIVFRGTADDVCDLQDSGLYIAAIGAEPRQLVKTENTYTYDEVEKLAWSVSYAVNPTQTHIAWTENSLQAQHSAVTIAPLNATDSPQVVFETVPVADPASFDYRDDEMLLSVVWLP